MFYLLHVAPSVYLENITNRCSMNKIVGIYIKVIKMKVIFSMLKEKLFGNLGFNLVKLGTNLESSLGNVIIMDILTHNY